MNGTKVERKKVEELNQLDMEMSQGNSLYTYLKHKNGILFSFTKLENRVAELLF
jgi:hypothetical protein